MIALVHVVREAWIVRAGHRREEYCLLRTEVPVRLREIDPPLVARSGPVALPWAPRGTPYCVRNAPERVTGAWWEGESGLLADHAPSHPVHDGPLASRPFQAFLDDQAAAVADAPSSPRNEWVFAPGSNPFQSREVVRPGVGHFLHCGLAVYPETVAVRTAPRERVPNARDIAVAHAARRSREMAVHARTGMLLAPSRGPFLIGGGWSFLSLVAHPRHEDVMPGSYAVTDEAAARASLRPNAFGRILPDAWRIRIERPDAFVWDVAASELAFAASALWLTQGAGALPMPDGMDQDAVKAALGKALDAPSDPALMAWARMRLAHAFDHPMTTDEDRIRWRVLLGRTAHLGLPVPPASAEAGAPIDPISTGPG